MSGTTQPPRVGDMKAGLTSARPKLSIVGRHSMIHQAAGTVYGADKYARGNYHGPAPAGVSPVDRYLGYIDAAMRHLTAISQAINIAKGTGGDQVAACSVVDDECSGGFPASMLPHMSHVMAGLGIAVECAVSDGLLPADPGQPWKADPMYQEVLKRRGVVKDIPQKDDPNAESKRVEMLLANAAGSGVPTNSPQSWPTPKPTNASRAKLELANTILATGEPLLMHLDARRCASLPARFSTIRHLVLRFGLNLKPPIGNLSTDDHGISGTIHFDGNPHHCFVPWTAVFALLPDGDPTNVVVWAQDVPADVNETDAVQDVAKLSRQHLSLVPDTKEPA